MIITMVKQEITGNIKIALKQLGIDDVEVDLELPVYTDHGDYSTSVALKLAKKIKKSPLEIADMIVKKLPEIPSIEKAEILKPGFINFWLSPAYLLENAKTLAAGKINYPAVHLGEAKKIMVEFAHPNTLKLFHIGHLRNITTGESIVRILEAVGNKVVRANYEGDVGLHIAKCLYKVKSQKSKVKSLKTLKQKIDFIGKMYTEGTKAYEEDQDAKKEIIEINGLIYNKDPEIMPLWEETRNWSLEYFNEIYKRVYSHFDRFYFESELPERGIKIAEEAVKNGVLEKSQGAIVFNGKNHGVDTRVFINSLGYPTYEGKELALAEKEFSEFGILDKCIHVVTPEQVSFFKTTFKAEELLDEKKYKNKQHHLAYEWVKLKEGKMSSREGNIIEASWLIDEAKKKINKLFKSEEETAESLAVAAVKYSFLRYGIFNTIHFDFDESISLEGNSAPYLIYTYVRTQSVLKKAGTTKNDISYEGSDKEERQLIRSFHQFPEVVEKSAKNLAPNYITNYLYNLAQQFNFFYQKHPILKGEGNLKDYRLMLTKTTGILLKEGLRLLGIKTVEKM